MSKRKPKGDRHGHDPLLTLLVSFSSSFGPKLREGIWQASERSS